MERKEFKCAAVVLAAGAGKRMQSATKKQFLLIKEKPIIFYSLKAFEESLVDEIILVTSEDDVVYCKEEIVNKYGFSKVKDVVVGGKERYHSVAAGLEAVSDCDYVFIHDAARPMLTQEIINRSYESVVSRNACVVGMPVKDTIQLVDGVGAITSTPDRKNTWIAQTPQCFSYELALSSYNKAIESRDTTITDDAMVVRKYGNAHVAMLAGGYENIKVTTPEDIVIGEALLRQDSDVHEYMK